MVTCTADKSELFICSLRYVFFLDPCNLDLINRKIKSIALCVSKCPSSELSTYEDLKKFSLNNGEKSSQKHTKCGSELFHFPTLARHRQTLGVSLYVFFYCVYLLICLFSIT